ncbi:MAG: Radical SAM superfamily protein [Syntrophorhabdaceae bacterium PtaU1.Bin034]|nr:MAG: Radical SAM superfamily protein [Syntrophorhabdaceae bacterium PtaU1.Bin034]
MRVLLVEPKVRKFSDKAQIRAKEIENKKRKRPDDESLWYPPLGLMKLSTFHKSRKDEVKFVIGKDNDSFQIQDLFSAGILWDRIYISTLFTFQWKETIETINFYKTAVGGSIHKIFVGGIMASLMQEEIFEETGVEPIAGILDSPKRINLDGNENIDALAPDYSLLDSNLYATNDTFYAYTTRGCTRRCPWCGVPIIEPDYVPYIDIKEMIGGLRESYGDKPRLKLMDNNVLASPHLEKIVEDLVFLGYGRDQFTNTSPKRQRVIDFNQGLDARYLNEENMKLLKQLNIRPMRIAFDNVKDKEAYTKAVRLAHKNGVKEFSNYMIYNFNDTPEDLYERLSINIKLNQEWGKGAGEAEGQIYSYPMRYAPIKSRYDGESTQSRDYVAPNEPEDQWISWTKRATRNIEVMKGAAFGAISPTPMLAWRTIGRDYKEFIANLHMPEELLRNRNKHEREVYKEEPDRTAGTGLVEQFRSFFWKLFEEHPEEAKEFRRAVGENSTAAIRAYLHRCKNEEVKKWLDYYLMK